MLLLVLGILAARAVYLATLCPYELVDDEAQYWDWSRRLALSYTTKGPGIAWLIALFTRPLGSHAWSVRLPSALASAVTALALTGLARDTAAPRDRERAAFVAAALFLLAPPFQLTGLLMTIDGPYIACWALAAWAAWRAFEAERLGEPSWAPWAACAVALGTGFLFKYAIALLPPGLAAYGWARRRDFLWDRRAAKRIGAAALLAVVLVSPVVVWNAARGWPGLAHLLNFIDAPGGDRPPALPRPYDPLWTLGYLATQIGIFGPALALVALGLLRLRGKRREDSAHAGTVFSLYCAAPMLLFYFLVSFRTKVEGNWALAAFASLLVPAALAAATLQDGTTRRWWRATVAYGLAAAALIHFPLAAARVPWAGRFVPVHRFQGFGGYARRVGDLVEAVRRRSGAEPFLVAARHGGAARLAFYMPGQPIVACAGSRLGDRRSAYDFFADTDLAAPHFLGRSALLVGASRPAWEAAFRFDELEDTSEDGIFFGRGYRGPRSGR
jgi:4-amino-4-deoxy-L-arabinose transferase-like glycosyltransferase